MNNSTTVDYGPLTELIGTWKGDKGQDVAPGPDGVENKAYYETITFTAAGNVSNAKLQVLSVVSYEQVVKRKSDHEIFHDETGYWLWDADRKTIMHSLAIPRAVCVLAGGPHNGEANPDGNTVLEVSAGLDDEDWQIIQSPFMRDNARTTAFNHKITVGNNTLTYTETTWVDIYGKAFEHTDQNELEKQAV